MIIDKNSRLPVYIQIMEALISQIEDGLLPEGAKLPSEWELCEICSVSRATVRQAVQELEKEGYVNTYRGRGTFVAAKRFDQEASRLYGFTESMKNRGKTVSSKVIDFSKIQCDERLAKKMQCAVGTEVFRLARVRCADSEPILIATTYLPCARFPDFDIGRLASESLYTVMADMYGVTSPEANEILQIVSARDDEAVLLEVKPGMPCMKLDRYTFEKGVLIEHTVGIARGDKFQYSIVLR